MRKIYAASSWRNPNYSFHVEFMRKLGHEVWDFRNPPTGDVGFSWREIDPAWNSESPAVSTEVYKEMLRHPAAERGFGLDRRGMEWADTCVMLLPCGRSAHLEAGVMIGWGKPTFIFRPDDQEPDLMYKFATGIAGSHDELARMLAADIHGATLSG